MSVYEQILEAIDGAHYVEWDSPLGLLYVWHGGRQVNIYRTFNAYCVDCFTCYGEDGESRPDLDIVREKIRLHGLAIIEMDD